MLFDIHKKVTGLACLMIILIMFLACSRKASQNPEKAELEETVETKSAQILTMEQAMDLLYENYVDAELFYPGELDKWDGNNLCYGFVYDDGDKYRYVWVNSVTGGVEFADEIVDYTGTGENY